MPPLRITASRSMSPLTAKPSDSSEPSLVWPPTSAVLASASTSIAPVIIWRSVSSTLLSMP